MNNNKVEKQTKELVAHMNDYLAASQLQKKGEAAIFDKHRLPEGQFAPGLNEELAKYRKNFADEWGTEGWRNTRFVEKQIEMAQRPTEEEIDDMYQHESEQQSEQQEQNVKSQKFLNNLKNSHKPTQRQGPKPR